MIAIVATALAVVFAWRRRALSLPDGSTLTWIADAHQLGPVGYRDPAGAISPDGKWIAYSEGRFLRVRPIAGGPAIDLNSLVSNADMTLTTPLYINSRGVIAGNGLLPNGDIHAFVLIPCTEKTEECREATEGPDSKQIGAPIFDSSVTSQPHGTSKSVPFDWRAWVVSADR